MTFRGCSIPQFRIVGAFDAVAARVRSIEIAISLITAELSLLYRSYIQESLVRAPRSSGTPLGVDPA